LRIAIEGATNFVVVEVEVPRQVCLAKKAGNT